MQIKNDLCERLFQFAVRCLKFINSIPDSTINKTIKYQLAKSSTSVGANYEESQAGSSRADFSNKVKIALREMRETNYWLRILQAMNESKAKNEELSWLLGESIELKNILGAIAQKSTNKQ